MTSALPALRLIALVLIVGVGYAGPARIALAYDDDAGDRIEDGIEDGGVIALATQPGEDDKGQYLFEAAPPPRIATIRGARWCPARRGRSNECATRPLDHARARSRTESSLEPDESGDPH